jgi:hypothetical protein
MRAPGDRFRCDGINGIPDELCSAIKFLIALWNYKGVIEKEQEI